MVDRFVGRCNVGYGLEQQLLLEGCGMNSRLLDDTFLNQLKTYDDIVGAFFQVLFEFTNVTRALVREHEAEGRISLGSTLGELYIGDYPINDVELREFRSQLGIHFGITFTPEEIPEKVSEAQRLPLKSVIDSICEKLKIDVCSETS